MEAEKSKVKVLADSVYGEDPFPGLHIAAFLGGQREGSHLFLFF
jgi:hypothetical protein